MITKARQLGMKVMVGSMNEGTIGTSAAAHLLPLLDYADMDGTLLLAEDIGTGITFNNGKIIYSEANGIGVVVKDF
jgi:L-alanine-DL-glutamate epimerase-like enolase superfamily enzyme